MSGWDFKDLYKTFFGTDVDQGGLDIGIVNSQKVLVIARESRPSSSTAGYKGDQPMVGNLLDQ